jgi:hypothetical protein
MDYWTPAGSINDNFLLIEDRKLQASFVFESSSVLVSYRSSRDFILNVRTLCDYPTEV